MNQAHWRPLIFAVLIWTFAVGAAASTMADSAARDAALINASYIYIATVRKDGTQSRAARVWFIATGRQILIDTNRNSWKAKRIRRGSPVIVWVGTPTGRAFIGKAEFVNDRAVQDFMIEQIPKKYWLAWLGLFGPKRAKFDSGQVVTIRITPERDLADGFQSTPGTPAPSVASEGERPSAR
jgi:PPOX class probable F420-dependent enzyme